ncbi:DUF2264 domain-containing protein [Chitinophaga arvensicola]|uniref:DUF2264 domain-containing protein n=1 Tax=Chitinophaga arvensicola TaxID=29529 RepID=A0A1I0RTH7_9BACT|nr:DUF2264 domain-containing protein [Chitinophaga arvensicola]SEW44694.1 hypothetical protein SAMN04488122_3366 [Chitinophaga arvensicola]
MLKSSFFFTLLLMCLGSISTANAQKAPLPPNGQQDRAFWVKSLYKISYPVIHHLAMGTLKQQMPLELGPGYYSDAKQFTYLEAIGRTLAGVAPWLALPDDNTEEGNMRRQLRQEAVKGLNNACNPADPDFIRFDIDDRQPIVDAAYLAAAFLRAPKALWAPLDSNTKKYLITGFKSLRTRSAAYNNWLLFAAIDEAFLLQLGEQYDPARIQFGLEKMKEWYAGDGWYSDGPLFSMDYYNSFVIHPMLIDLLSVLVTQKKSDTATYHIALKRMQRYAEFQERMIAPDGTFPVFGRSMTYRNAAFQALAQCALLKQLPETLSNGQVRAALTAVTKSLFAGNQNFDKNGWLVLGLNGHQPMLADAYTSTGSLYMATLSFLPLGLPADDPFWTEPAAPWTSVKAWSGQSIKKDYKVNY